MTVAELIKRLKELPQDAVVALLVQDEWELAADVSYLPKDNEVYIES